MKPAIFFQETIQRRSWLEVGSRTSFLESGKSAYGVEWNGDWTLKSIPACVFIHIFTYLFHIFIYSFISHIIYTFIYVSYLSA